MFHPTMAGRRILWKPLRLWPVAAPTITATKVMPSSRGISSSNLRFTAPDKPPSDKLKARQEELMKRGLPKRKPIPGVKHVILVSSGKGGVGKSTTAVNLALALSGLNLSVGILDADIFGPSIPTMMNISGRPELSREKKMLPLTNFGIKCMSIGLLVDPDQAVVWRGPMVMGAISKLINDTDWSGVDVLVVDTPPGTGDILLSLAQTIHIAGAVIVSTPQKVALVDAAKGIDMFNKVHVPVLGLVENMAGFICGSCGATTHIFGRDGARALAEKAGIRILGSIPLDPGLMDGSDEGKPFLLTRPQSQPALQYADIARHIQQQLQQS